MVKETSKNNKEAYQCEECSLHYEVKEQAEKCEKWCRENNSCNLEIIADALENREEGN